VSSDVQRRGAAIVSVASAVPDDTVNSPRSSSASAASPDGWFTAPLSASAAAPRPTARSRHRQRRRRAGPYTARCPSPRPGARRRRVPATVPPWGYGVRRHRRDEYQIDGRRMNAGGACSGFVSGLCMAAAAIEASRADTALVVGADLISRVDNPNDRVTAGHFGDGAGAVVVRAIDGSSRIGPAVLRADGSDGDAISTPSQRSRLHGRATSLTARGGCADRRLAPGDRRAGLTVDDIDPSFPTRRTRVSPGWVRDARGWTPTASWTASPNMGTRRPGRCRSRSPRPSRKG
jgi:hypothetical protein